MHRGRRIRLRGMGGVMLPLAVGLGMPGASAAEASGVDEMEVIEVVGSRRDEGSGFFAPSPSSSLVVPEGLLEGLNFKDLREIATLTPGVSVSQSDSSRASSYSIRGSHEVTFHELSGGKTGVAYYLDDIPFLDAYGREFGMFAASAVTVHKGPHGTSFGAPGPYGAFEVVTREPEVAWEGEMGYSYSSHATHQGKAHASGPLAPGLLFGIDIQQTQSEGWYKDRLTGDPYGEEESTSILAKLVWQATEKLEFTATAGWERHDDDPAVYLPLDTSHFYTVSADPDAFATGRQAFQALRAVWKEDDWQIKSITSHRHTDFEDRDGALLVEIFPLSPLSRERDQEITAWTQEIRVESTDPDAEWRWRTGVFFSNRRSHLDHFILGLGPREGADVLDYDVQEWAAYGEISHTIADRLELSGGMRLQLTRDHSWSSFDPTPLASFLGGFYHTTDKRENFTAALPMAAASWKWSDNQRSYLRLSTAMQPGGLEVAAGGTSDYDSQKSFHYELGHDGTFLDGGLSLHAAAFYTDYRDYQVFQFNPAGQTIFNAEHAHAWGVEGELRYRVTDGLEISAGAGYTHARYDELEAWGRKLGGKRIPNIPQFTINAGANYRAKWGGVAAINWRLTGKTPFDDENAFNQGIYSLLDARIGFERENFGIYLFGRNLGDTSYFTHSHVFFGQPAATAGSPRMMGTEVRAIF